ncbi:MAG: sugar ABC transporter permease [bacterium]|nr:sugar ABC transporter permease [bacterium]
MSTSHVASPNPTVPAKPTSKTRVWTIANIKKDFVRHKYLYLMALPVVLFYILFHYMPMYGALIAFKNYVPTKGFSGSAWVGFKHFRLFFQSEYFLRLLRNTFLLSFYNLLFGFPAAITLALLLNEVRHRAMKTIVQTVSYIPHFISLVVICGMVVEFSSTDGLLNDMIVFFGGPRVPLLSKPEYFRTLFVSSGIWQQVGWNSIIFLAALAAIDPGLYEASEIDGANRFQQLLHITLPSIISTIIILLILRIGQMMMVGHEKVILLYNEAVFQTADVINSYVYRVGLQAFNWSFSAAVGLFNSLVNLTLLLMANYLGRRFKQTSLW